jgi:hypothetical protein
MNPLSCNVEWTTEYVERWEEQDAASHLGAISSLVRGTRAFSAG